MLGEVLSTGAWRWFRGRELTVVLARTQIVAGLVRILHRAVLLDGHRLLFLLACVLLMKQIAQLRIHVVPDLFHRAILFQLDTVADSELSPLKLTKYPIEFLLFLVPRVRIVVENACICFTADDNFESALGIVQLTFNFELRALLSPFIDHACTRLNRLFSIGSSVFKREIRCRPLTARRRLKASMSHCRLRRQQTVPISQYFCNFPFRSILLLLRWKLLTDLVSQQSSSFSLRAIGDSLSRNLRSCSCDNMVL